MRIGKVDNCRCRTRERDNDGAKIANVDVELMMI